MSILELLFAQLLATFSS